MRVDGSFRFASKLPENFPEDRPCPKVLRPRAACKTAQTRRRDGRTERCGRCAGEIPGWDADQVLFKTFETRGVGGEKHPTLDFKAHQNSKAMYLY